METWYGTVKNTKDKTRECSRVSVPDSGSVNKVKKNDGAQNYRRNRFGLTPCKRFVVVGNEDSELFIYDVENSLTKVHLLEFYRIRGEINSVSISHNVDHIIFTTDNGFIWRFEYMTDFHLKLRAEHEDEK